MNVKKLPALSVFTLSLVTLSGCGFKAAIETAALTAAMQLPYMLNYVDLATQEFHPSDNEEHKLPITERRRAQIDYLRNVMVIPKSIEVDKFGIKAKVEFEIEGDDKSNFVMLSVNMEDLGEGISLPEGLDGISLSAYALVPVGIPKNGTYKFQAPEYTSNLESFMNYFKEENPGRMMEVVKITEQEEKDLSFTVKGKIKNSSKQQTYYFHVNETTLEDLANLAGTSLEDLGIPTEILDLIENWPEEPTQEMMDFVNDNWPSSAPADIIDNYDQLPPEVQEFLGDPEDLIANWPDPEEAQNFLEENWPESFSDMGWAELIGMFGGQGLGF